MLNKHRGFAPALCVRPHGHNSIDVLVDNPLRHRWPRRPIVDIVNEWSLRRAWHVVNDDIWLGCKSLKKIGELVQCCDLPAILDTD